MKTIKLILLVLIISSFSFPAKETKLEYKFNVGDQYAWTQRSKQVIIQQIMGMEQVIENAVSGSLSLKVISLTPDGAKLEVQYTTLTMVMTLPAGMSAVSLDSEGDIEKTENKVMRAMMNKPFTITLTKQGVVANVEGEENLWSGFAALELDPEQLKAMQQQFEQNFGKNSIKSSFEMALVNYPSEKVSIGKTWKNKTGVGMSFPLAVDNTWNLLTLEKDNASLSADGLVSTTDKEQIINLPNGLQAKIDLSGTQKSTSSVNVKSGWPSTVKTNSEINGKMILIAGGMIPTDIDVPMHIVTESNFAFVKK